jgi:hypothetical protein
MYTFIPEFFSAVVLARIAVWPLPLRVSFALFHLDPYISALHLIIDLIPHRSIMHDVWSIQG